MQKLFHNSLPNIFHKLLGKDGDGQPTFTQMSQWRGVLHRLKCFIRLIDFLVMELLRRLVLAALRTLLAQVKASSMHGIVCLFFVTYEYILNKLYQFVKQGSPGRQ